MAKPFVITEIARIIRDLEHVRPYSTSPDARIFRNAISDLKVIESVLLTIDAFKPGAFRALVVAAVDELQVEHDDPPEEVADLIKRYSSKRERLR